MKDVGAIRVGKEGSRGGSGRRVLGEETGKGIGRSGKGKDGRQG